MNFLFASQALNISLTIVISLVVIALIVFERIMIRKHEAKIKRGMIALIYMATLLLVIGAVIGILLMWDINLLSLFSTSWDDIVTGLTISLSAIIGTVITIFIWLLLLQIARISLKRIGDKKGPLQKRRKTITKITYSVINYAIAIISIIVIMAIWGINVIPALAGLGIVGLIIGLGAQKFIQDLIAGFFIIFEHHFDVGDVIEVSGFKGTVIDIGLKTTKIRNWKGDIRILNNGDVNTLINYSKNPSTAVVDFSIAHEENLERVFLLLNESFPKFKSQFKKILLEDPVVVGVTNLGSDFIEVRVTVKTLTEQHTGIERALRKHIKEVFDANQIRYPFAHIAIRQED